MPKGNNRVSRCTLMTERAAQRDSLIFLAIVVLIYSSTLGEFVAVLVVVTLVG